LDLAVEEGGKKAVRRAWVGHLFHFMHCRVITTDHLIEN